jgi:hypothetical protein
MKIDSSSSAPKKKVFNAVLSEILSASQKQVQDSHDEAKRGKFSSHTRYKYIPAKRP